MARESINREVIICENCEGQGYVTKSELADYHRGEYDYWDVLCSTCKGSGRLERVIKTITSVEPYTGDTAMKLQAEYLAEKLKE